jgi:hypothetical protein
MDKTRAMGSSDSEAVAGLLNIAERAVSRGFRTEASWVRVCSSAWR